MDEKVSGANGGDLGTRETDPGSVVVGRETLLPDSVPEAPGAEGDGPRGPGDPRDGAETRAESPRTSGAALRVTDSAPGSPPGSPGAGLETLPRDLWRDRLRVVRDGAIYLAVAFAAYKLRMADKLDPATGIFMLLIAGVRAQNIAEFLTRGRGAGPGSLAGVAILGIPAETFRSFFRS